MKSLVAEGVKKLVIVTDEPEKYDGVALEPGVTVHHRDELDRIQRELREIEGTTAIIYDQTCATEKRRRRKRGKLADAGQARGHQRAGVRRLRRLLRAEQLPERGAGGDRVRPQAPHQPEHLQQGLLLREGLLPELRHGRRRAAEEAEEGAAAATCRRCRRCPSRCCRWPRRPGASWSAASAAPASSPSASCWAWPRTWKARAWSRRTPAAWRRRAAPPGATSRSPTGPRPSTPPRSTPRKADLVIACDAIVGASKYTLAVMQQGRTFVALNTHGTPTAAFVKNPTGSSPAATARPPCAPASATRLVGAFDAEQVAVQLLGDSIYTNPLMLGYAWQQGRVPLSHAALMRAIELNGVQVDNNKAAFEWGRRCAHDLAAVQALFKARAGDRVRQEAVAGRDGRQARGVPHRLPGRGLCGAVQGLRRQGARGRGAARHEHGAERSRGALPVQADGLQGRVRGGAAAHRPGLHWPRSQPCSRATTSWCTTWRRR